MIQRGMQLVVVTILLVTLAFAEKASAQIQELSSLNQRIGQLYQAGRYAEALTTAERYVALASKLRGEEHSDFANAIGWLGFLYTSRGRYAEAEPLLTRSLSIYEKLEGRDSASVGTALDILGGLYRGWGRYAEAEPILRRALAVRESALGPNHVLVARSANNLAGLLEDQGRYSEAEPLYKRALAIEEKALGPDHSNVGTALSNLGLLYRAQGRYADAEPALKRALAIKEKALGPDHADMGIAANNLGQLYLDQRRFAEAEPLMKRALVIREKTLGPEHPGVAVPLNNLAGIYRAQGRYADAEPLYKRALSIGETALGPNHPNVGTVLYNLAQVYASQGRYAEAEALFRRDLAIAEGAFGPDHMTVGQSLSNLAGLRFAQQDWSNAIALWQRSTDLAIRSAQRGYGAIGTALTGNARNAAERVGFCFWGLIKAAHRFAETEPSRQRELAQQMFAKAQWAVASEAAASLAQMAARQAKDESGLARLVRERQDLVVEWQGKDKSLVAAVSQPSNKRNAQVESELRARLSVISDRIGEIDKTLAVSFPEYATLASPEPLNISEVQTLLHMDEAVVLILDTPEWKPIGEETFIWVITKTDMRWVRSDLGTPGLRREVAALRCGLDGALWHNADSASKCVEVVKKYRYDANIDGQFVQVLPFDLGRAHALYKSLFGQVEDLIKDKHLLIVPSGPLTSLPFQILVTEKPEVAMPADTIGYVNAAWLAKRHSISVLPSASSLKALRQFAKTSKAAQPFIGFGNPLLLGPDGNDRSAWERQSCKGSSVSRQVASRSVRAAIPRFFRNGLANVEEVRTQYPLPETADELCAVARSLGAGQDAVYLGEKASETAIKAVSATGTLAQARVVHFATHGLLAGETEMLAASKAEPALLLTPPAQATEEDDGLLTASEIAQLKLDADWVVLSACNTAAGGSDNPGAEALSGLARAFFYAGARALLVSHWAVDSDATVKLIIKAFDEIKADPKIGRAEALRRSMLALIASYDRNVHPANWAPFVMVGEGAR